jgi:hypothetical protein
MAAPSHPPSVVPEGDVPADKMPSFADPMLNPSDVPADNFLGLSDILADVSDEPEDEPQPLISEEAIGLAMVEFKKRQAASGTGPGATDDDQADPEPEMASPSSNSRPQDSTTDFQKFQLVELPIGSKENKTLCARYFGFSGTKAWDTFVSENPLVVEVMQEWNAYRSTFPKGNTGKQVRQTAAESVLNAEETASRREFSLRKADKVANWDALHWHAYFLYKLENDLCVLEDGQFYYMGWGKSIRRNRMWILMQHAKVVHPFSAYVADPEAKAQALEEEAQKLEADRSKALVDAMKIPTAALRIAEVSAAKTAKQAGKRAGTLARGAGVKPSDARTLADEDAVASIEALVQAKGDLAKIGDAKVAQQITDYFRENLTPDETWGAILAAHLPEKGSFKKRATKEEIQRTLKATFAQASREQTEHLAAIQKWMALKDAKIPEPVLKRSRAVDMVRTIQSLHKALTGNELQSIADLQDDVRVGDAVNVKNSLVSVVEASSALDAQDLAKLSAEDAQALATDQIADTGSDAAAAASMAEVSKLLSNTKYEYSDFAAACKDLGVDATKPLRLASMTDCGISLYWFQLCEVWAIRKKIREGVSAGVLLAALVGLGKTFTIGAFILKVSR